MLIFFLFYLFQVIIELFNLQDSCEISIKPFYNFFYPLIEENIFFDKNDILFDFDTQNIFFIHYFIFFETSFYEHDTFE